MQDLQEVNQAIEPSVKSSDSGNRVLEHVVRNQSSSEFRLTPSAIAVILAIAGGVWVIKSEISEGRVETVRLIEHVKSLDIRMDNFDKRMDNFDKRMYRLETTVDEIKEGVDEIKGTLNSR